MLSKLTLLLLGVVLIGQVNAQCSGACQDIGNYCPGDYIQDECPGPDNIQCCPEPTPDCNGRQDNSLPCDGSYEAGDCPGPDNVQCCTSGGGGGGSCGGNCPGGSCPTCYCGTDSNYISDDDIQSMMSNAGIPSSAWDTFICIIGHESSGNANAENWNDNETMDIGLAQINQSNEGFCGTSDTDLCDPQSNINCAALLYASYGFNPWSADGPHCGF